MGQHLGSEPHIYYFRLEDQIPDDHLLKRLDRSSISDSCGNRCEIPIVHPERLDLPTSGSKKEDQYQRPAKIPATSARVPLGT
jgi:hypothetical protein